MAISLVHVWRSRLHQASGAAGALATCSHGVGPRARAARRARRHPDRARHGVALAADAGLAHEQRALAGLVRRVYEVPEALTLRPGSFNDVAVTLSNRGWLTWQSDAAPMFALSYHWLTVDTEEVVLYDGLRTPFPQPVDPGDDDRACGRECARPDIPARISWSGMSCRNTARGSASRASSRAARSRRSKATR